MLVVGLTGGIGSGKSIVAKFFAELGAEIIDTDQLAREVVLPGTDGLNKIVEHFGITILNQQKQLDRHKLRDIIFQNPQEREWLEQLLHPLIRKKTQERINASQAPYCVAVIPLLVESKSNPMINRILVIDAPEDLQISRTMQRDHLSREQILAIMQSQASREQRLAAADDVIYNDQELSDLKMQVLDLHKKYLELAKK